MYLRRVTLLSERVVDWNRFPFTIPCVRELDISFDRPIAVFVGENGSGKSTVLEAIAQLSGLPVFGGARADVNAGLGPEANSPLAGALRPSFQKGPRDGYFCLP